MGRMSKRTWSKLVSKDWDYWFLLKIEQLKLRRMCKYFAKHGHTMSSPFNVRDMKVCDKLISVILEEDNAYKAHVNQVVNKKGNERFSRLTDTVYVNTRNEYRFFRRTPIKDNIEDKEPYRGENGQNFRDKVLKMSLRQLKAMHLYNMIREYKMFHWWD